MAQTYWNGEPTPAQRVLVVVADSGQFPKYWAWPFVGQRRAAVEVHYGEHLFYLDNEDGRGWAKVTEGHGSPRWAHSNLEASQVVGVWSEDQGEYVHPATGRKVRPRV
jgi:hypothetical protein